MRCLNCGTEIPANSLYCEKCGTDVHIVPDFEPEVELNIEKTISRIAKDIIGEEAPSEQEIKVPDKKNPILLWVSGILCLVLVFAVISVSQYYSISFQTERAKQCVQSERYDKAIYHYQRALELSDNDVSIKLDYAEVFFLKNDKEEYENLLRQIVEDERAGQEQIESAYGKLIAIYRAREDFKSINELLLASKNEEIIFTYQNYVAKEPEFSIPEGYYTTIQPLKLSAYGKGKIFYTLDGTQPDENSYQYTAPIILDNGIHTINAYFVNEFGIASECVTKSYNIEIEELSAPVLSAMTGEYHFPIYIEVLEDSENVYYTTDGSEPGITSIPYTKPIPMPLGKSTFKFIRIEDGITSEVVERNYDLVMNTQYTPQDAEKNVIAYSIQSGKIYHEDGYSPGVNFMYLYQYEYVINIEDEGDFFIVSEIVKHADETQNKTGNYFAVNAYNMEVFKLQTDENNNYILVEIENQS